MGNTVGCTLDDLTKNLDRDLQTDMANLDFSTAFDTVPQDHINSTVKKASSALSFIRRNLQRCPKASRHIAYVSLVRSLLEYGSMIWDTSTLKDIDKLERIQRQAARFITRGTIALETQGM